MKTNSKFNKKIFNRSKSNEPIIFQKPPKITRSNTVNNKTIKEPNFEKRLPSCFFRPKNIFPDLNDLIKTLNQLKKNEIQKNFEPAPWQHSTFKNNPLHCNSSEFEDYDDKLKIENYKTYGDINRSALKIHLNSTKSNKSRRRFIYKTGRNKPKPKNKRYNKRKKNRKKTIKNHREKIDKIKSRLFDSLNGVKLKKFVKKHDLNLNNTLLNINKKRQGLFSCCFEPVSQNKDYYLIIPESEIGTLKSPAKKEENILIFKTDPWKKKSLKLYKKRKPIIGQNLFFNDISRITSNQNLPSNQFTQDNFTSITKFNDSSSKLSVLKHIYKLYSSDTINFIDDRTYVISKSNGSTSTRRVRNFFLNTSPQYDNNEEFISQFRCYGSVVESTKKNLATRKKTKSLSHITGNFVP